jgi:hypothetical protein
MIGDISRWNIGHRQRSIFHEWTRVPRASPPWGDRKRLIYPSFIGVDSVARLGLSIQRRDLCHSESHSKKNVVIGVSK